jgi:hypothetical protein
VGERAYLFEKHRQGDFIDYVPAFFSMLQQRNCQAGCTDWLPRRPHRFMFADD